MAFRVIQEEMSLHPKAQLWAAFFSVVNFRLILFNHKWERIEQRTLFRAVLDSTKRWKYSIFFFVDFFSRHCV